jgi:DNA-binding MarR family transcriptional regulator
MGATLAELEARGLITRQPDPGDGRRILMSISAAGRREVNRRRDTRVEQIARGLADFTDAELAQLAAAVPLIERLAHRL